MAPKLRKYRWSRDYESAEEELQQLFVAKKYGTERLHAEAFEAQDFSPDDATVLWCAEGSMHLEADGQRFSLQPGDAIDVPTNTPCHLTTGISGCAWYRKTS